MSHNGRGTRGEGAAALKTLRFMVNRHIQRKKIQKKKSKGLKQLVVFRCMEIWLMD